jgi:hypothetical protein
MARDTWTGCDFKHGEQPASSVPFESTPTRLSARARSIKEQIQNMSPHAASPGPRFPDRSAPPSRRDGAARRACGGGAGEFRRARPRCGAGRRHRPRGPARGLCARHGRSRGGDGIRRRPRHPGSRRAPDPLGAAGCRRCRDRPAAPAGADRTRPRSRPRSAGAGARCRGRAAGGGGGCPLPGAGGGADRALGHAAAPRSDREPTPGPGGGRLGRDDAFAARGRGAAAERGLDPLAGRVPAVAGAGGECTGSPRLQPPIAPASRGAG